MVYHAGMRPLAATVLLAIPMAVSCSRETPGESAGRPIAKPAAYAPRESCAGCHPAIAKSFAQTGMGRAFSEFRTDRTTARFEGRFYHKASGRHYTMTLRDGTAYLRRHEAGPDGKPRHVLEKRIDYILGSGHKAQTFLHRTPRGELLELPVAWYVERGGYWAMNPNYDRPDHDEFRRRISYDCFFCHNAYPELSGRDDSFLADAIYPEKLPGGIDCQRCHGPAAAHVEAARSGASPEALRNGVVNPARLDRDARMEICMQCHLQSTSRDLPHAVIQPGRGVFSHRAGEPLSNYIAYFDHAPGTGFDGKFEIAHAAYRLRQSKCFTSSRMDCTTCHDPHSVKRGQAALAETTAACVKCHASPAGKMHASAAECVSCHMPLRRTEDVVEVVMHDHRIVRRPPPGNLIAPRKERDRTPYRGKVAAYYPAKPGALPFALAQVRAGANLAAGLTALEAAILAQGEKCGADCYYDLAEAYGKAGRASDVARAAAKALELNPRHVPALRSYGAYLSAKGDLAHGAATLERALAESPGHARTMHDLAANYLRGGRRADAIRLLRGASAIDPDAVEVHLALAAALNSSGDAPGALAAFEQAVRAGPGSAAARYGFAVTLAQAGRKAEALWEAESAARLDPARGDARLLLAMLLAEQGDLGRARLHLNRALLSKDAVVAARAREIAAAIGR
jgi:predicted CXXCH cytochrome family protein